MQVTESHFKEGRSSMGCTDHTNHEFSCFLAIFGRIYSISPPEPPSDRAFCKFRGIIAFIAPFPFD
jgi:hypothetical protein